MTGLRLEQNIIIIGSSNLNRIKKLSEMKVSTSIVFSLWVWQLGITHSLWATVRLNSSNTTTYSIISEEWQWTITSQQTLKFILFPITTRKEASSLAILIPTAACTTRRCLNHISKGLSSRSTIIRLSPTAAILIFLLRWTILAISEEMRLRLIDACITNELLSMK